MQLYSSLIFLWHCLSLGLEWKLTFSSPVATAEIWTSLVSPTVKRLSTMRETQVLSLGQEDPLEKQMAVHSRTIAWKIPWTEEPGRLQSMGLQRVGHAWAASLNFSCVVAWYILISISLVTSDAEHAFISLMAFHILSLVRCLFRFLCVLDNSPLSGMSFANMFCQSVVCLFVLLALSFTEQKILMSSL